MSSHQRSDLCGHISKKNFSLSRIADQLHRCKSLVSKWQARYKTEGISGLYDKARSGRPPKLTKDQEDTLKAKIQSGPIEADDVSVFRGKSLRHLIENDFSKTYSISGLYALLKRLKFRRIKPRPRHEKNDKNLMDQWKKQTLPSKGNQVKALHPTKEIEIWFQDEMRFGEKTRITSEWKLSGTSYTTTKQLGFRNHYIFGAACPATGDRIGLTYSTCSTEAMSFHLSLIGQHLGEEKHAIVIMDQAGWHSSAKKLVVPANITILDLPPYSPELNPIERLWLYLKENYLSNLFIKKSEDLSLIGCDVWNKLTSELVKTICHEEYLSFTNYSLSCNTLI